MKKEISIVTVKSITASNFNISIITTWDERKYVASGLVEFDHLEGTVKFELDETPDKP